MLWRCGLVCTAWRKGCEGRAEPGEEQKSIPRDLLGAAAPPLTLSIPSAVAKEFHLCVPAWLLFSRLQRWKLTQETHAGTFTFICTVKLHIDFYCQAVGSTWGWGRAAKAHGLGLWCHCWAAVPGFSGRRRWQARWHTCPRAHRAHPGCATRAGHGNQHQACKHQLPSYELLQPLFCDYMGGCFLTREEKALTPSTA